MIKNQFLKKFITNVFLTPISFVNNHLRHDNKRILLYSNLGFRDNIKALYDYLIEHQYNKRYKIYCCVNDYKHYKDKAPHDVMFKSCVHGPYYYLQCKYVFYCFGKLPIVPARDQMVVQMWHGSPFKAPDESMLHTHKVRKPFYTYALSAADFFVPIWSHIYSMPQDRIMVCGHPRTDVLLRKDNPTYDFGEYEKLVLWAPTFRKSSILGYNDTEGNDILPILKTKEDLQAMNNSLQTLNIKVVVKLHPMQDLSAYSLIEMSNIILLSQAEFIQRTMDLYILAAQSDALITDYSSMFYDYLLTDNPIGFTVDDEKAYKEKRGFVFDNPKDFQPGDKLRNFEELLAFFKKLSVGEDHYKQERARVRLLSNKYTDGQNCLHLLEKCGIK